MDVEAAVARAAQHAELREWDEAAALFAAITRELPTSAAVVANLAYCLERSGRLTESLAAADHAVSLTPRFAGAHNNRGTTLRALGRFDEAVRAFELARECDETLALAEFNAATTRLLLGEWSLGWAGYERRFEVAGLSPPELPRPRWRGESLQDRTILLIAEQGLGDTIQFCRYANVLHERGTRVILAAPGELATLLESLLDVAEVVGFDSPLPPFDVWSPLLSVPGILETRVETIPSSVPYLSAGPDAVERWSWITSRQTSPRIGIAWKGNPAFPDDARRSVDATRFGFFNDTGITPVNLQMGAGPSNPSEFEAPNTVWLGSEFDEHATFADTAAIVEQLDLVISVDTAIAHLAGALGKPVWVALPFVPEWRWLLDRDDSPWYPTARLFRQSEPGGWDDVFDRIGRALRDEYGVRGSDSGLATRIDQPEAEDSSPTIASMSPLSRIGRN